MRRERTRWGETRRMLRRNPGFARLYAAQLISFGGDWFAFVALQAMVLELTRSPGLAGLMLAAHLLPSALMSPFAGAVVDRVDRRVVMVTADLLRCALALGPLLVRDRGTLWIAFVTVALMSAVHSFFDPASQAALPNMVRDEDLPLANVLIGSAWGTMLAVGAALGGIAAATLGRTTAFVGDAGTFLISAAIIASIRAPFRTDERPARGVTIFADIVETIRFARAEMKVLSLLVVKGGFGIGSGVLAMISVLAVNEFHAGEAGIGFLMSARGAGALVGPFIFRRLMGSTDRGLFQGISIAFVIFAFGYLVLASAPTLWIGAIGAFVAHIGGGAQWTMSTIGLQRFTPDRIRGRIFSFDYGFVTLTLAGSGALAGGLADSFDPRLVTAGFACLSLCWAAAWTLRTRRWWPRAGDTHPPDGETVPTQGAG